MPIPISQFIPPTFASLASICLVSHLYLYFCFANKFICTFPLDSTYKRYNAIFAFSF